MLRPLTCRGHVSVDASRAQHDMTSVGRENSSSGATIIRHRSLQSGRVHMYSTIILADDIGSQLLHGILSLQFLQFVVALLFAILFPVTSAAIINYLERKVMAWMQDRLGPFHVGPQGSLQLMADVGKMLLKEDLKPVRSDRVIFLMAPSVFIAPMVA